MIGLVLAVALCLAGFTPSSPVDRADAPADARTETKHLTVATSAPRGPVAPGTRLSLWIDVTPKPSMHVYAPGQKDVIPISLSLANQAGVRPHVVQFPKPEEATQLIYSKPFRIVQDVTVRAAAGPTLTVKGALKYQACDDSICYAPVTVPVAWTLELKQPGKVTP
jgi:DsbC/DsbD-like thiol-disulfide interchange protein